MTLMASLLVFAIPNLHPDPTLQWTKYTTGDVIDIRDDDNFFWGSDIQGPAALGWWKVVCIPGVQAASLSGLLVSGPIVDATISKFQMRTQSVNVSALAAASIPSGVQPNPNADITTDMATVQSMTTTKPPLTSGVTVG